MIRWASASRARSLGLATQALPVGLSGPVGTDSLSTS